MSLRSKNQVILHEKRYLRFINERVSKLALLSYKIPHPHVRDLQNKNVLRCLLSEKGTFKALPSILLKTSLTRTAPRIDFLEKYFEALFSNVGFYGIIGVF